MVYSRGVAENLAQQRRQGPRVLAKKPAVCNYLHVVVSVSAFQLRMEAAYRQRASSPGGCHQRSSGWQ